APAISIHAAAIAAITIITTRKTIISFILFCISSDVLVSLSFLFITSSALAAHTAVFPGPYTAPAGGAHTRRQRPVGTVLLPVSRNIYENSSFSRLFSSVSLFPDPFSPDCLCFPARLCRTQSSFGISFQSEEHTSELQLRF